MREQKLKELTRHRWLIANSLTAAMVAVYFGFMMLVGFKKTKAWLGTEIVHGLSWGILLGALVIVAAWVLTFIYVRWANTVYDPRVEKIRNDGE